jgi:hypothetical protein
MQMPEHLLPEELRIRVQSYLRTPTAELMREVIKPWEDCKAEAILDCVSHTGDQEQLTSVHQFIENSFSFQGYILIQSRLLTWTHDVVEDEEEVETDNLISLHI